MLIKKRPVIGWRVLTAACSQESGSLRTDAAQRAVAGPQNTITFRSAPKAFAATTNAGPRPITMPTSYAKTGITGAKPVKNYLSTHQGVMMGDGNE